jgi:hypothetical protein
MLSRKAPAKFIVAARSFSLKGREQALAFLR